MNFNFQRNSINISSSWFDKSNINRKIKKIKHDGLNLYFNLFRFLVAKQENPYTFITSIGLLKKQTHYSNDKVIELLKLLKFHKIIKITNLSRWEYILDKDGNVDLNKLLIIEAIDYPMDSLTFDENKENKEYWITVDLGFIYNHYSECGLDEWYFPLYCLMRMLSSGQAERKCYMAIENMAEVIGYDKKTINRMIHKMIESKVLYSRKVPNGKNNDKFEHYLCFGNKYHEEFLNVYYTSKGAT
jgi:hypothetical protein